jgi:hypothetical protein
MAETERINRFLQATLEGSGLQSVAAVEAARWLDDAGLLRDSRSRPGKPLRDLLRSGVIKHARQDGRFWYIDKALKAGASAPVVSGSSSEQGRGLVAAKGSGHGSFPDDDPLDARASESFREVGFRGFVPLGDVVERGTEALRQHATELSQPGVYAIFASLDYEPSFRCDDGLRNVIAPRSEDILRSRWISGVELVYIGCAGRTPSSRTLHRRLRDLLRHGGGLVTDNGPHKGGERVWQCVGWQSFTLAWRASAPYPVPHEQEVAIGMAFQRLAGALPFANERL